MAKTIIQRIAEAHGKPVEKVEAKKEEKPVAKETSES
tara:strand:+ start:428 stop:538 length:111 start_codon:yes stop_codon:yes gene_type:complete